MPLGFARKTCYQALHVLFLAIALSTSVVTYADEANRKSTDSEPFISSKIRTYDGNTVTSELQGKIDALEKQLPDLMKKHHVPGVSLAVISDRAIVYSRGYGVRCAGTEVAMQPDTVMEACSMTKPFFGYLVLKLAEEKKFDLDRPLVEYLGKDYLLDDPRHHKITARMVLTHTSGLPNWREGGWRSGSEMKLRSEPGTKFRYSGEGFLMLQRAVEKAFNTNLDKFAREQLIDPLKLSNSRLIWDERFLIRASCGHSRDGNVLQKRVYFSEANGAYTLYTTAEDFAGFLVEILKEDRSQHQSISTNMRTQMLSPCSYHDELKADWGLGWGIRRRDQGNWAFHHGANGTGFRCYAEYNVARGEGLVIMTNGLDGEGLWKALVAEWHGEVIGKE